MSDKDRIRWQCPVCNKSIVVNAKHAGKRGKCPRCQALLKVPMSKDQFQSKIHSQTLVKEADKKLSEDITAKPKPKVGSDNGSHAGMRCEKCNESLRIVRKEGKITRQPICVRCSSAPGICPICSDKLRTDVAQQCPNCFSSWHEVATSPLTIDQLAEIHDFSQEELRRPEIPPHGSEPYLEVLVDDETVRYDNIEVLYYHLIQGKLTRHNLSRWIEPKPVKSKDPIDTKYDLDRWRRKLEWRPIGEQVPGVRKYYEPEAVYAENAHVFLLLVISIPLIIITSVIAWRWEGRPGNAHYPGIFDVFLKYRLFQQLLIFAAGMSVSLTAGHLVGHGFGILIGDLIVRLKKDSILRAPDDGYVSKYEEKLTTDLSGRSESISKSNSE